MGAAWAPGGLRGGRAACCPAAALLGARARRGQGPLTSSRGPPPSLATHIEVDAPAAPRSPPAALPQGCACCSPSLCAPPEVLGPCRGTAPIAATQILLDGPGTSGRPRETQAVLCKGKVTPFSHGRFRRGQRNPEAVQPRCKGTGRGTGGLRAPSGTGCASGLVCTARWALGSAGNAGAVQRALRAAAALGAHRACWAGQTDKAACHARACVNHKPKGEGAGAQSALVGASSSRAGGKGAAESKAGLDPVTSGRAWGQKLLALTHPCGGASSPGWDREGLVRRQNLGAVPVPVLAETAEPPSGRRSALGTHRRPRLPRTPVLPPDIFSVPTE